MDKSAFLKRREYRVDITAGLYHLTKPQGNLDSVDVLMKILLEKKLIGSTTNGGYICGQTPAVCFQDIPLYSVAQNVYYEQELQNQHGAKIRYEGTGLAFGKFFIYKNGGRPVVYDKLDDAKRYLPADQWWRIVNLDLASDKLIDWTHEREWRVPGNLTFELHVRLLGSRCFCFAMRVNGF